MYRNYEEKKMKKNVKLKISQLKEKKRKKKRWSEKVEGRNKGKKERNWKLSGIEQ